MDFRFIHVYPDAAVHSIDSKTLAKEIAKILLSCNVDVRQAFMCGDRIERARIADIKQPFERQPEQTSNTIPLYDGFVLQRIFAETIPVEELDHVHVIFTSALTCTFNEDDWRYHARAVVCGTPSIVSTSGIVEAPAKPREFYLAQLGGAAKVSLKKKFAGRFIDYDDDRMTAAATAYALQALFFFVGDGEPFCIDKDCRLYNAHWQEELINMLEKGAFCTHHERMANKFNNRKYGKKSS